MNGSSSVESIHQDSVTHNVLNTTLPQDNETSNSLKNSTVVNGDDELMYIFEEKEQLLSISGISFNSNLAFR